MRWQPGLTVGPYEILGTLGGGGMATVYRARHARLGRTVALKVLHPALHAEVDFQARFIREARIVAQLEHPHIVPVHDFDDHDGQSFLVMKDIDGGTLKQLMTARALTLDEILHVLDAVAAALDYAHRQGVLHRDVKPSNILLGADGTPYLADFGLARIAALGESTLSRDVVVGTPNYLSPEQAEGAALDARADVYALGVLLYELVVGRVPFAADTPHAVVHQHIHALPPRPSALNPEVPPEVEAVLLRALEKRPADRYTSAGELAAGFRHAVDASGLVALDPARRQFVPTPPTPMPAVVAPPPSPAVPQAYAQPRREILLLEDELTLVNMSDEAIIRRRQFNRAKARNGLLIHAVIYALVNVGALAGALLDPINSEGIQLFMPLLWGAGLFQHAVSIGLDATRRLDWLQTQAAQAMTTNYGQAWQASAPPGTWMQAWENAQQQLKAQTGWLRHAGWYVGVNVLLWWIYFGDRPLEFPWPLLVNLVWGVALGVQASIMMRSVRKRHLRDVEDELTRERRRLTPASDTSHTMMLSPEKPKNNPLHTRLAEDGELSASAADALSDARARRDQQPPRSQR